MNIKQKVNKYGFWVIFGTLIIAMVIINLLLESPLSGFGCIAATFVAEIIIWLIDLICFGYKDSTVRLWLSGGIAAIIVGVSILALGGAFIENFDMLDISIPWMFMASTITFVFIVSSHHILLYKERNKML